MVTGSETARYRIEQEDLPGDFHADRVYTPHAQKNMVVQITKGSRHRTRHERTKQIKMANRDAFDSRKPV
jgi:hypothetical protein